MREAWLTEVQSHHFPMPLVADVVATEVSVETYREAVTPEHIAVVFPDFKNADRFQIPKERDERARPLWEPITGIHHRVYVLLMRDETLVGWFQGGQTEGLTFYMQNSAVLPAFQRQGLYSAMLAGMLRYLRALGYEEVTSHHLPDNNAILVPKLKAGFLVDGIKVDQRHGWLLCLRKSLHSDRERATRRHYRVR